MHGEALDLIEHALVGVDGVSSVLEIGGKGAPQTRAFLRKRYGNGANIVVCDMRSGGNVDVVIDKPYDYPFPDKSFDLIVSVNTLEHVDMPWCMFVEIERLLVPGGFTAHVAPSCGGYHAYPVDCWRFMPDGWDALAKWSNLEVLDRTRGKGKGRGLQGQWGDCFVLMRKP